MVFLQRLCEPLAPNCMALLLINLINKLAEYSLVSLIVGKLPL